MRNVFKAQITTVLKQTVSLFEWRVVAPTIFACAFAYLAHFCPHIGIEELPCHAVGKEHIITTVAVKVSDLHGPGPIGGRKPCHLCDLQETRGARVDIDRVAHVLPGRGNLKKPAFSIHVSHIDLLLVMRRRSHVRGDQIELPVTVEVPGVASHGEPRCVRHGIGNHISEDPVLVITIEVIRPKEIVRDVEIYPPVRVVVPPGS